MERIVALSRKADTGKLLQTCSEDQYVEVVYNRGVCVCFVTWITLSRTGRDTRRKQFGNTSISGPLSATALQIAMKYDLSSPSGV